MIVVSNSCSQHESREISAFPSIKIKPFASLPVFDTPVAESSLLMMVSFSVFLCKIEVC